MSGRTYRLSPPDRTGWVLGLGGPQVVTLGAAIVVGVVLLQAGATMAVAGLPMVVAAVAALGRVGGRPLLEWSAPTWRWLRGRGGTPDHGSPRCVPWGRHHPTARHFPLPSTPR